MNCFICKNGKTRKGNVTVMLEHGGSIIAVKDVSAQVCQNCKEYYLDAETTRRLLACAAQAVKDGVELEIISMDKVA